MDTVAQIEAQLVMENYEGSLGVVDGCEDEELKVVSIADFATWI